MKKIFFLILSLCMSASITCINIHKAAKHGNLARVQELLTNNPELVNARDNLQTTPLHFAAFWGHTDVASLLLNHGANVNARDNWKDTPLHFASLNGHTEVASLLLHYRADTNTPDNDQITPLHAAAYNDHTEVASLLLHHGADLSVKDNNKKTPLYLAALNRWTKVEQLLKDWPYYQRFLKNQLIAFFMAQYERLGSNSPANVLPNEMFYYIAQFVIPRWPNNTIEQIHKIAEQERQQEYGTRNIVRFFLSSGGILAAAICATITYRLFRR